jgi:GNAT superfamily N-acetyltransferase
MTAQPARWADIAASRPPNGLFVAVGSDDVPVAYCYVTAARDAEDRHPDLPTGELCAIYADPPAIATGAGTALHAVAVEHLTAQGFTHGVLWVFEDNHRARRFYETHGWSPDGGQEDFEFGGRQVPELRYSRPLEPARPA